MRPHLQPVHRSSLSHALSTRLPGEKRTWHRHGRFCLHVSGASVGAGASVQEAHPELPADGGPYTLMSDRPLFTDISDTDINQLNIANCWALSVLAWLAETTAGDAHIKSRVVLNPANPQQIIVYFSRNSVHTAVFVDFQFSNVAGTQGPDGDVWALAVLKAFAFYRTGANLFHSQDYGTPLEFAYNFGLTTVVAPRNTAEAISFISAGKGVFVTTPVNVPSGWVARHVYNAIAPQPGGKLRCRNPWGSNSGGALLYVDIADQDIGVIGLSLSACAPPPATPLPLPDSVTVPPAPAPVPLPPAVQLATPLPVLSMAIHRDWMPQDQLELHWMQNDPRDLMLMRSVNGGNFISIGRAKSWRENYGWKEHNLVRMPLPVVWTSWRLDFEGQHGNVVSYEPTPAEVLPVPSPVTEPITLENLAARVKVLEQKAGIA